MRRHRAPLGVALLLVAASSSPSRAAPPEDDRIAVIVGSDVGASTDERLLYAEKDARRIRDLLVQIGGVRPERAITILREAPEAVLKALREARGRAAELRATGRRVTLLFFYSGHGDEQALHLPRGTLSLAELRRTLAEIPADLRLSLLDACRTGGVTKGIRRGPSFALAVAPDGPRGTVELRASSVGEAAQESNDLASSLFTHYLASGLRGAADVDRDGRVTLAELYAYVYGRTLLHSARGGLLQHPALSLKVAGAGEIVLTRPVSASASIEVPGGAERYLVFEQRTASVLGELPGQGGARLALPAGRFIVVRRRGAKTGIAEVDLSWGGVRRLGEREFRPIAREELAVRGGAIELRRRRIEPQVGLELMTGGAEGPALRAGAAFSYARGALVLGVDASFVGSAVDGAGFSGVQRAVSGGPTVAIRWFWGRWCLAARAGVELRYSWQHLTRHEASRVQAAGLPWLEERSFGALGPRLGLRVELPLGHNLVAGVEASWSALFRREVSGDQPSIVFRPAFYPMLGLGYLF